MSQILSRIHNLDPNDNEAAKEALSTFIPNLKKHIHDDCIRWLCALENVINRFPKLCGIHRNTIEAYLSNFLDSSSYFIVVQAAKCAHILQQVRPAQEKASRANLSWKEQLNALCNAVHALITEIFPNAANIYKNDNNSKAQTSSSQLMSAIHSLTLVSGNSVLDRERLLSTRLRNVFIMIQAMLVEIFPIAKPVRPQQLLDVIIRALGASGSGNQAADIVSVKMGALRTLDALVACLGSNLIPFSPLVFKCVMQTLRWSSENPGKDSGKVRIAAYNSLALWLTSLRTHHCGARARNWHLEFTQHALADVTPTKHLHQLTMTNQTRNLSKKQKKKQAKIMLQQSSIASYSPSEINKVVSFDSDDEVAMAALECLETFLTVCGIFLEPATHKAFHEVIIRECFSLSSYTAEVGLRYLRVLESCRKTAPATTSPPTQYCLQLYSELINSQDREISTFCSHALLNVRLHLHCSPPSLNFATEVQRDSKTTNDKMMVSRKNREALESLLGADKMPKESYETAMEPVDDEPIQKKPRLEEDITDQISLSSESGSSVEICDNNSEDDEIEEIPITEKQNEDRGFNKSKIDIHNATTQICLNVSNDITDGPESPKSLEVAYGYANTGTEKVTVLDKLEDENLPSTNETDDIQITCGQVIKASFEDDKKMEIDMNVDKVSENEPKVNGIKSPEKEVVEGSVTVKISANGDGVSVEDMLADFVDEVNDDNIIKQA